MKRISNWWRCKYNDLGGYCARYKFENIECLIIIISISSGNFYFPTLSGEKWNIFQLRMEEQHQITLYERKLFEDDEFFDNLTLAYISMDDN